MHSYIELTTLAHKLKHSQTNTNKHKHKRMYALNHSILSIPNSLKINWLSTWVGGSVVHFTFISHAMNSWVFYLSRSHWSPFWNVEHCKIILMLLCTTTLRKSFFFNFFVRTAKPFNTKCNTSTNRKCMQAERLYSLCTWFYIYIYVIKYAKRQSDRMMTPAIRTNTRTNDCLFKYW